MSNKTKTLLANKISLKIIVFFCFFIDVYSQHNQASVYDLKSEHLVNPIGLDVKAPRLTWKINDSRRGAIQKSYDISVGTDSIKVAAGNGSYWNTGKINSSTQMVVYDGKQLKPYQKYYWLLKVWDKNNQKMKSEKLSKFSETAKNDGQQILTGKAHGSLTVGIKTKRRVPISDMNLALKKK